MKKRTTASLVALLASVTMAELLPFRPTKRRPMDENNMAFKIERAAQRRQRKLDKRKKEFIK